MKKIPLLLMPLKKIPKPQKKKKTKKEEIDKSKWPALFKPFYIESQ
jgi:hypothetical protein